MEQGITLVALAFNHKKFVEEALQGFVNQRVNIPYKVIVADDCSTDGTDRIIREYAEKYPNIIFPIIRAENFGIEANYLDAYSKVDTEYVAYCECDDYFTDSYKLQKQVDFLEQHSECSICFHKSKKFYEDNSQKSCIIPTAQERFCKQILDINDLLKYNFIPSNSVVYRWRFVEENIYEAFPRNIMPLDYYMHFLHAEKGKIGFINETMSCYRKHKNGTWYDEKTVMQKHGIKYINFNIKVWENFANRSIDFFKDYVFPLIYQYANFCEGKKSHYTSPGKVRKIRFKKRLLIILALIELAIILALYTRII